MASRISIRHTDGRRETRYTHFTSRNRRPRSARRALLVDQCGGLRIRVQPDKRPARRHRQRAQFTRQPGELRERATGAHPAKRPVSRAARGRRLLFQQRDLRTRSRKVPRDLRPDDASADHDDAQWVESHEGHPEVAGFRLSRSPRFAAVRSPAAHHRESRRPLAPGKQSID